MLKANFLKDWQWYACKT